MYTPAASARRRLFHRTLPHVLGLGVSLLAAASFLAKETTAHSSRWLPLLLSWLLFLVLAEPRLARGLPGMAVWLTSPLRRWATFPALILVAGACRFLGTAGAVAPAALAVGLGLVFRGLVRAALKTDRSAEPELIRLVILLGLTFWLASPYATTRLVGAGDAEHYARQLADFVTQIRHHEFPVFVGQSLSAFSGSVHPLRVAPYFQYAGGLLDVLTGQILTPVALQNLLICASLFAAVLGAYCALTRIAPRDRRRECVWLALLYGSSPGVLALMYRGDMLASWTTLPWLPWLFLGWVLAWRNPASGAGLILQACSLAFIWLAHAPIALWAVLLTLGSELMRWAASGFRWRILAWQAGAALLCLLMCVYVFVSVALLDVPENPYLGFDLARGAVFESVRESWHGLFRRVGAAGSSLAHDLHLSPGLLFVGVLGALAAARVRGAAPALALAVALLMLLLLPWPAVTGRFWAAVPVPVMTVMEKWPVQRFYPLLSAMLPFLGVLALAHPWLTRPKLRRALLFLLVSGVLWSAVEARKFVAHGQAVTRTAADTARFLLPENNTLSRYSYEMWGYLPRFFSFGYMDPETQNRLIDPITAEVRLSNTSTLQPSLSEGTQHRFTYTANETRLEPAVVVPPGGACFISFEFEGGQPEGTLLVEGKRLSRRYELPTSGGTNAFGALPGQNRGFLLRNLGDEPEETSIRFVSRTPGSPVPSSARVAPYDNSQLPFRLRSLMPFELEAVTEEGGWLETPKLLIPGYRVTVNGQPVEARRSPNGLLMIPVPAGTALVRLEYDAPWPLTAAFAVNSGVLLAGLLAFLIWRMRRPPSLRPATASGALAGRLLFQLGRGAVALGGVIALVTVPAMAFRNASSVAADVDDRSGYHLRLKFPVGRHEVYETLLSWSDSAGATSSVVVFYESDRYVRVGCRKNGILKVLTEPLPVSYFVPNEFEISRDSAIRVRFNQHVVLETDCDHQAEDVAELAVGREIDGNTPANNPFRGQILEAHDNFRRRAPGSSNAETLTTQ